MVLGLTLPLPWSAYGIEQELTCASLFSPSTSVAEFYALDDLPLKEVPPDLEQLFHAYSQGLEPDLSDPTDRQLFAAYLATRANHHDPVSLNLTQAEVGHEIENLLNQHPNLSKALFPRVQLTSQRELHEVPNELDQFTKGLLQRHLEVRDQLFNSLLHKDYWPNIFGFSSSKQGPLSGRTQVTNSWRHQLTRILTFFKPDPAPPFRELSWDEFERQVLGSYWAELTNNLDKEDFEQNLYELFKFLGRIAKKMKRQSWPVDALNEVQMKIINLSAFSRASVVSELKSNDPFNRIEALGDLIETRERFAVRVGFEGGFDEAHSKLTTKKTNSWLPKPKNLAAKVQRFHRQTLSSPTVRQSPKSFEVRQLSIAESPFRSQIGGDIDTSSNTHFDFSFEDSLIYFTMTNLYGTSKGHASIVLGHAGDQNVALLDQVQNVDKSLVLPFLEAVRRILDSRGYTLALSERQSDTTTTDNSLSQDPSLSTYILNNTFVMPTNLGHFDWQMPSRGFSYSHTSSRYDNNQVRAIESFEFPNSLVFEISLTEPAEPFRLYHVWSLESYLEGIAPKQNGSEKDQISFFHMGPALEILGHIDFDSFKRWVKDRVYDSEASLSLKIEFIVESIKKYPTSLHFNFEKVAMGLQPDQALKLHQELKERPRTSHKYGIKEQAFILAKTPEILRETLEKLPDTELINPYSPWAQLFHASVADGLSPLNAVIHEAISYRLTRLKGLNRSMGQDFYQAYSENLDVLSAIKSMSHKYDISQISSLIEWLLNEVDHYFIMQYGRDNQGGTFIDNFFSSLMEGFNDKERSHLDQLRQQLIKEK